MDAFVFAFLRGQSTMNSAMRCEHCDNKATVFYTQIVDGISKKKCLCESCATEQGITDPEGFLLGAQDTIKQGPAATATPKIQSTIAGTSTRCCPGCGFAFDDLKKTGRLGCSECYNFFRKEIKHNLGGMHKGTSHTGRVPEGMAQAYKKRQELEELQQKLDEAVTAEDYEKAAALRDQIGKLSDHENTPSEETKPS